MDFSKKRKTEENGDADSLSSPPSQAFPPATVPTTAPLAAEDIRKILRPFSQEQLLDLLQSASLRHSDVLDAVRAVADRDSTLRKLFVRGLAGETTSETLRSVFSTFGELDEAIVIFDKATGRSKGYGFVVFRHVDGAILALKDPSKKIDGRMTVTQLAAAGGPGGSGDVSARKVFVGNVPFEISSDKLLSEFLKFGEVEEGPLGFDKSSGKSRGFAFFVYKTEEGARASLVEPVKTIDGHQVICKLAVDSKKTKPFGGDQHQHQHTQHTQHQQQQQQHPQQQMQQQGPMMIPQYGGYGGNGYGIQHSVPPYNNPVQVSGGGGYGHGIGGGYGNSQMGGPVSGDYGTRLPPNSGGGFPEGSQYGYPASSTLPPQQQVPMPRPPPGGMYQGVPPYY
ncbi:UBP1-associated protein 2C [Vigna radiata var. radiata]|uniref:UBP1-associated protein 2C n=1 Tax=Vigna radiata var. radiata TaxID=3916 RepID=A0A1S3USR6_VIGRR|nr:UBP1-associated protein 2C [Vigna radiata var. radiata]XP_014509139.1 UBP1-associated protein 2C [Vigna radiata var. radiata]XP_014509140.1 UBP1-associated protein 2C [Vigna radiata var. radiata]XP_022638721.1 UBP1-associated protein 2C [Vigna radiata var. radiata]XP_022638722.1 UBP1-associated protein 2C [Vigna radiata var. radiata]XP_022638724.1 UBP1-associated protein 2C [Vigna radiata var. radiata]XP_022638725.1 UBP1-associated protein 2C [Vigna radiata var. radiata]XP_022638726.1 UBP